MAQPRMTATEELKPCPFCGNKAHTITTSNIRAPWSNVGLNALGVAVVCDVCGATQPAQMDEEKAVEYWNRRAEHAIDATLGRPKVKKVRGMTYDHAGGEVYFLACSGCGEWIDGDLDCIGEFDGPNFCPNCGGEFDGPKLCSKCGRLADLEYGDLCAECYEGGAE